jgi:hypothetical protein
MVFPSIRTMRNTMQYTVHLQFYTILLSISKVLIVISILLCFI